MCPNFGERITYIGKVGLAFVYMFIFWKDIPSSFQNCFLFFLTVYNLRRADYIFLFF